jgi:proteasome lid subunit RPN8/RPN11
MSTQAFVIPREIQVVVDSNDRLHISVGTPGYVEFKIDPVGMKLPIKCWIHTHPMGKAYFSGTDWRTLKTWKPMMETAIVLGDNEYWAYTLESEIVKTVRFATLTPPKVGEEE